MPKVVKGGKWKPENMDRAPEAFPKGYVGLNAASRAYPLQKDTSTDN
jgi:hypothetical protein